MHTNRHTPTGCEDVGDYTDKSARENLQAARELACGRFEEADLETIERAEHERENDDAART